MKKLHSFVKEYKFFALALFIASLGIVFDSVGASHAGFRSWAHIILGAESLFMALVLFKGMVQDLRDGTYGVDLLAVTAIVTSVVLKEYWTAMITVLMLTGGEALEDYSENRAKGELTALLESAPKTARIIKGRKTVEVPIHDVKINDKVVIQPGELVPVDCVILEGTSSFDESSLTGESLPIDKDINDELLSGSINIDGVITARAIRKAEDSQFELILKIVKNAAGSQSPFVRLADRYSIPFTLLSFGIGFGVWISSGDPMRFLQVLVVATPCPLLLGAPIGLISGMSRAAKHGIIIKNGAALERLANIKTIAFDKTGTLTVGKPVVENVVALGKNSQKDILSVAAALEKNSTHILAEAIVTEAIKQKITIQKVHNQQEHAGHGISGSISKDSVQIGRLNYLNEAGIKTPKELDSSLIETMATFVAKDGQIIGYITFADELRPESKSMLKKLNSLHIRHTLMITGDNEKVAKKIADSVGIEQFIANCLPADKVAAIGKVDAKLKPLAFVGDGVNDAPVLTTADVGIALGARGSAAASESADIVIMLDDVNKVAESVEIAKNTFRITKQSILTGIGMSIGLMVIFATGKFKPVYGAAIQELVDVSVILSALRAHGPFSIPKIRPKHKI